MPLLGEDKRAYEATSRRREREDVREIGPPPDIADESRRDACRMDLLRYLTTYHPQAFALEFSDAHLRLIRTIESVILEGGSVVVAMPRGSGKTTIAQRAELWAALYGHRRYPMIVAADDVKFKRLLRGIKTILESNELLAADFPEVCHPIRSLERIANRANYQMCRGQPTHMAWGTEQLVLPTLAESTTRGNAGVVIGGGGLTSAAVRGSVATTPAGEQVRPDAVLIDDPQTRKSAKSPAGVQEREDIISGDILGMAGPGKRMAAVCTATVIYRGDLTDRLLDAERSPDWQTVRVQTILSWPKQMGLWETYDGVRRQELLGEIDAGSANNFYTQHRDRMDEGAAIYWPARVDPGKLSALQSAMDEYLRDPRAFMSERQNTPEEDIAADIQPLNPMALCKRITAYKRGVVPADVTHITAHIDVQEKLLYWMACGWTQTFRGYVLDYGTYPKQSRRYFILRDASRTLKSASPGNDDAGALKAGLITLMADLSAREWHRVDGGELHLDRGLVDARWKTEIVEASVIESRLSNWVPSYGVGIRAKDAPLDKWTKKRGVVRGNHWLMMKPDRRLCRSAFLDANWWKSQAHQALLVPPEHSGAITLYQETQSHHQLIADQLASERASRVEARGRIVDEWELPTQKPDNHFWDNLVACMAAASMLGVRSVTAEIQKPQPQKPRQRVKQLRA